MLTDSTTTALVGLIREGAAALRIAVADLDHADFAESAARRVRDEADGLSAALARVAKAQLPEAPPEAKERGVIPLADVMRAMDAARRHIDGEAEAWCPDCGGLLEAPETAASGSEGL